MFIFVSELKCPFDEETVKRLITKVFGCFGFPGFDALREHLKTKNILLQLIKHCLPKEAQIFLKIVVGLIWYIFIREVVLGNTVKVKNSHGNMLMDVQW